MRGLIAVLGLLAGACASAPRDGVVADAPLRIASWNLEHLAEANDSGCRPRTDDEYEALRAFAERLDADVIAFQEVESAPAAARVFDPEHYAVVIEERPGSGAHPACRGMEDHFLNRQAVGFAIRRDVAFTRHADVTAIQLGEPDLRSGVDVSVRLHEGSSIRLLALHLKSGCASGDTGPNCDALRRQAPLVERWVEERAAAGERFAVLGDFNRRLDGGADAIWSDWDDGTPDLALAGAGRTPACDPRYTQFIDHIIIAGLDAPHAGQFSEWPYEGARLSDHCPISVELSRTR